MLLSTAKRFVKGYTAACKKRTGNAPERKTLSNALRQFGKALKHNSIPL